MTKLRLSWPNRITIARILLIGPFVMAMLHLNDPRYAPWSRYAALATFLCMAASDALDGWLARRSRNVTTLGAFLDPLADKLLITCASLLLAAPATAVPGLPLPDVVVVIIIGKDLYTVLGFLIVYLVVGQVKIAPDCFGKAGTVLQVSLVAAILASPEIIRWLPAYRTFVVVLWWLASACAVATVLSYTRKGSRFLSEYENRARQNHSENPPTPR